MPLTAKGTKIKEAMQQEYGEEKGERVFYASKNAGKITGVDSADEKLDAIHDALQSLNARMDVLEKDCE